MAAGNTRAVPVPQNAIPIRMPGIAGRASAATTPRPASTPAIRIAVPRPSRAMTGVPPNRLSAMAVANTV